MLQESLNNFSRPLYFDKALQVQETFLPWFIRPSAENAPHPRQYKERLG